MLGSSKSVLWVGVFLLMAGNWGEVRAGENGIPESRRRMKPIAVSALPIHFIKSREAVHGRALYTVLGHDSAVHFSSGGLTLGLTGPEPRAVPGPNVKRSLSKGSVHPNRQRWSLKLDFVGANTRVEPAGEEPSEAQVSFFKGPPSDWITGLRTYSRITYSNLWPGINLEYSGSGDRLKYTLVVQPGADPHRIHFRYRGATSLGMNVAGRLEIVTPTGSLLDEKPAVYQEVNGGRVPVSVEYALDLPPPNGETDYRAARGYHFQLGTYDRNQVLTIDPALFIYNDAIGGAGEERGLGMAVDHDGNAYVCGQTTSAESTFPELVGPDTTFNGAVDAYILKLGSNGTSLIYAGYIGGAQDDGAFAVGVDANGNAYVCGFTASSAASFPVGVGPGLHFRGGETYGVDAFVAKVDPSGTNLLYCGYIGGVGDEAAENIAVDPTGNAFVTGYTTSTRTSFPVRTGPDLTHNGGWDTFIARVRADGSGLVYCGYIGGAADDAGASNGSVTGGSVAIDEAGCAYVCSFTASHEDTFPNGSGFASLSIPGADQTFNGGTYDAFVARVSADGTGLLWCTYIGGANTDGALGIGVDAAHNAYVGGYTSSSQDTFPVRGGPDLRHHGGTDEASDSFVTKISADGTTFIYSGYIGGPGDDAVTNLRVDPEGYVYLIGQTESSEGSFPVVEGPDLTLNGVRDAFVAKLKRDPTNTVVRENFDYCGYIGLSGADSGFDIGVDDSGNAYACGDLFGFSQAFVTKIGLGINGQAGALHHFAWSSIAPTQMINTPFPISITARDEADQIVSNHVGPVRLASVLPDTGLFSDNFEDGSISDWAAGSGTYTRQVTTVTAARGSRSLTLIGGSGVFYNGVSHALANIRPERMTFYVRASSISAASGYCVIGTGPATSQLVAFFYMENIGAMGLSTLDGFYATTYAANRWYKISLALNWASKQLDLYVDDGLVSHNIPFVSTECGATLGGVFV